MYVVGITFLFLHSQPLKIKANKNHICNNMKWSQEPYWTNTTRFIVPNDSYGVVFALVSLQFSLLCEWAQFCYIWFKGSEVKGYKRHHTLPAMCCLPRTIITLPLTGVFGLKSIQGNESIPQHCIIHTPLFYLILMHSSSQPVSFSLHLFGNLFI